jgi:hypothetical protein
VISLALIGRPQDYTIFWALPVLPLLVAITPRILAESSAGPTRMVAVLWICLAVSFGSIRLVKVLSVLDDWNARDPDVVASFVAESIPAGSRVFGPEEYYFYAVERAGSVYYYAPGVPYVEYTSGVFCSEAAMADPHLRPILDRTSERERERPFHSTYLIWPESDRLPGRFDNLDLAVVARFVPEAPFSSRLGLRINRSLGFPATVIYAVPDGALPTSSISYK